MSLNRRANNLTPAAARIVDHCRQLAQAQRSCNTGDTSDAWCGFLVLALVLDESQAGACLQRLGITRQWLAEGNLGTDVASAAVRDENNQVERSVSPANCSIPELSSPTEWQVDAPDEFRRVIDHATAAARRAGEEEGVSSAQLLLSLLDVSQPIRDRLAAAGVAAADVQSELGHGNTQGSQRLSVDFVLSTSAADNVQAITGADPDRSPLNGIWRAIDANLNRAREGLRVLEDVARFVLDDADSSLLLKQLRHDLVRAEMRPEFRSLSLDDSTTTDQERARARTMAGRDTANDVGTALTTSSERHRDSVDALVAANSRRVQEAFRSLEEFGKVVCPSFAADIKQIRYRSYELEKSLSLRSPGARQVLHIRQSRLQASLLYVLVTESACRLPWKTFVTQILEGGADVLQLREKHLADRELLSRARWMADACRAAGALCVINDRTDIAVLADADGVHIGQEELGPSDARKLVGADRLIGISTHNLAQVQIAMAAGADYLGVGPVFPSSTKVFANFPGLEFVREAAHSCSLPWFAIGGVSFSRMDALTSAGARRIAVTAALADSDSPCRDAMELRAQLSLAAGVA